MSITAYRVTVAAAGTAARTAARTAGWSGADSRDVPDQHPSEWTTPDRPLHRLPLDSDVVELLTVGIDVGSATFHLTVSRVVLERRAQELSTSYDVVAREVVVSSPVSFTPYLDSGEIDAAAVGETVRRSYAEGGVDPEEIDTGVVLLTGAALLARNARALAERLAGATGRFVCAAAGHHFEAVLAAHGSGAVARSRETPDPVVALDIGGATTKLALVSRGEVRATAAVGVGSRLLAWDPERRLVRVEQAVLPLAESVGVAAELGHMIAPAQVDAVCDRMALAVVAQLDPRVEAVGAPTMLLTDPFPLPVGPFEIVASGGVAEYLVRTVDGAVDGAVDDLGDLGPQLARALRSRLEAAGLGARLRVGDQRIRATVIGASQFSTQVSGSTIAADAAVLPLHQVPVVRPVLDLGAAPVDPGAVASALAEALRRRFPAQDVPRTLAVSLRWRGDPAYPRLRALAAGLVAGRGAAGVEQLVVAVDTDVASSLGRIMTTELGVDPAVAICLDNLDLAEFDHVDIGLPVGPAKVVPVVVKSFLFGAVDPPSPRPVDPPPVARSEPPAPMAESQGELT